ncbi:twin-arginine translocation signal domain-containing protein [Huaxiibacter chinensis]
MAFSTRRRFVKSLAVTGTAVVVPSPVSWLPRFLCPIAA